MILNKDGFRKSRKPSYINFDFLFLNFDFRDNKIRLASRILLSRRHLSPARNSSYNVYERR